MIYVISEDYEETRRFGKREKLLKFIEENDLDEVEINKSIKSGKLYKGYYFIDQNKLDKMKKDRNKQKNKNKRRKQRYGHIMNVSK